MRDVARNPRVAIPSHSKGSKSFMKFIKKQEMNS